MAILNMKSNKYTERIDNHSVTLMYNRIHFFKSTGYCSLNKDCFPNLIWVRKTNCAQSELTNFPLMKYWVVHLDITVFSCKIWGYTSVDSTALTRTLQTWAKISVDLSPKFVVSKVGCCESERLEANVKS